MKHSDDNRKLLVIGWELGDARLVRAWAEQGHLPQIRELLATGSWAWLRTTADQLHISAWPSIYTGTTPGEHGVYFTFQPAPGLQGYQRFHTGLYGRATFWHLLDQAGRRCSVFDPPYSHPEANFGGNYIYDWGSWAHYLKTGSRPDTLLKQLERCCGRYPLGLEANDLGLEPLDADDIQQRLLKAVQGKTAATCWLMQQAPWDVTFSVFGETHVGGHYCWSATNPERMLPLYRELDRAIAELLKVAGPHTSVMLISGDSVGPNHAGWHLLPEVLVRLGYLAQANQQNTPHAEQQAPRPRFDPVKAVRDLLPKDLRKNLARMLPTAIRDKLAQRVDTADIDWSRTRAYWLPTDLEGYIRINLKGREPQGIVAPGSEYQSVLTDLSSALLEMRDASSGMPIVREVIQTDLAFPGHRRDYLPDLIVLWNALYPISAVSSPRLGRIDMASPDPRTGTHTGPAFLLAAGPRIGAGRELANADITDIAPTILALNGVAPPEHMRGRVLHEMIAT